MSRSPSPKGGKVQGKIGTYFKKSPSTSPQNPVVVLPGEFESAIKQTYALVTMVDVFEGDCYVVDLRHGKDEIDSTSWQRFVIDTGSQSSEDYGARFKAIASAVCEMHSKLDPWKNTGIPQSLPTLHAIIITHSDRDHSGNAESLVTKLKSLPESARPSNFFQDPVRVFLSPMIQWSRNITEGQGGEKYFNVEDRIDGISVTDKLMKLSVNRTFKNLDELCKQAGYYEGQPGYRFKYRFNLVKPDCLEEVKNENSPVEKWKDREARIMNEKWGREIPDEMIHRCTYTQETEWVNGNYYDIKTVPEPNQRDVHVLVEILLQVTNQAFGERTIPSVYKEPITGPWLRTVYTYEDVGNRKAVMAKTKKIKLTAPENDPFPTIQATMKDLARSNSFDEEPPKSHIFYSPIPDDKPNSMTFGIIPTFEENKDDEKMEIMIPSTGKFSADFKVIGFEDDNSNIFPNNKHGHYVRSFLGCAGQQFVRDFQHIALQSLSRFGKSNPYWSEYANRASIITSFVFDKDPDAVDGKAVTSQHPGEFQMLFTGDAFELQEGQETLDQRRAISDNTLLPFKAIPKLSGSPSTATNIKLKPDGNLLNWLWRPNGMLGTQIKVDVLKVPHHGSSQTTGAAFYSHVIASVYLISGGTTHYHPTTETMATILRAIAKEGTAESPDKFQSKATEDDPNLANLAPIKKRHRPHLIFMNFGVDRRPQPRSRSVSPGGSKGPRSASPGGSKRSLSPTPKIDSKKKKQYILDWLENTCVWTKANRPDKNFRVNCKFFIQRKEHATSRLKFGRDDVHPELRVEWELGDWKEIRFDLSDTLRNKESDPIAYPMPGESPLWEQPLPSL